MVSVDYLPCVLILQEHSGPHSVSDFCLKKRIYPEKVPMFCVVSLKIKSTFFFYLSVCSEPSQTQFSLHSYCDRIDRNDYLP